MVFYWCAINFVPNTRRFSDIWLQKMSWPWNPDQRSVKVTGNDTYRSATYDFLLTLHSNNKRVSHRFRDKRRFQSKVASCPTPCILNAPADGIPLEIGYRRREAKTRMMGLRDGRKSFKIVLALRHNAGVWWTDARRQLYRAVQSVARVKKMCPGLGWRRGAAC